MNSVNPDPVKNVSCISDLEVGEEKPNNNNKKKISRISNRTRGALLDLMKKVDSRLIPTACICTVPTTVTSLYITNQVIQSHNSKDYILAASIGITLGPILACMALIIYTIVIAKIINCLTPKENEFS